MLPPPPEQAVFDLLTRTGQIVAWLMRIAYIMEKCYGKSIKPKYESKNTKKKKEECFFLVTARRQWR